MLIALLIIRRVDIHSTFLPPHPLVRDRFRGSRARDGFRTGSIRRRSGRAAVARPSLSKFLSRQRVEEGGGSLPLPSADTFRTARGPSPWVPSLAIRLSYDYFRLRGQHFLQTTFQTRHYSTVRVCTIEVQSMLIRSSTEVFM